MAQPILSICIPTYNRAELLDKTLYSITSEDVFLNTNYVEIIISNNCSTDNTDEICKKYADRYPEKIKYISQKEPIYSDIHIFKTIEYASGIFCKLNNDTCQFKIDALDKIINFIKENINLDCIFFSNKENAGIKRKKKLSPIIECSTYDDFLKNVSYNLTWIGSFCIKKSVYEKIDNPMRYAKKHLAQVDIYGWLFEHNYFVTIYNGVLFNVLFANKKGGNYNVAEVFGENYFSILNLYLNKPNGVKQETFEKEKKKIVKFINYYYFDHDEMFSFNKTGYLKYLWKLYKTKLYFYRYYIANISKVFAKEIITCKKTRTQSEYKIFNFIKFKVKRKCARKSENRLKKIYKKFEKLKSQDVKSQIWFDHTCGGGSETYSLHKISELKNKYLVIRIQSNNSELYKISLFYKDYKKTVNVFNLEKVKELFEKICPESIVVSQLASYKNTIEILQFIKNYKKENNVFVSFRGHDFQALCPSIVLLGENNIYCGADKSNCEKCFENTKNYREVYVVCDSIKEWQQEWQDFINNVCDEILVFSQSTYDIFLKFFPEIENKTILIPHETTPLRKVNIKKHNCINIGVLGTICSIHKGAIILKQIDKLLLEYPNVKFKIIGSTGKYKYNNIKILGRYNVSDLPDIVEKEDIDAIFISSVWPETFSYTTSEAMSMGIGVACFDLGAPVERVKKYEKGLVISKIDPRYALDRILDFYEKQNL